MSDDPYRYFRLEASELLEQFGAAVLDLEKEGKAAPVERLLRLAHTLKGAARVVKLPAIADNAHAIEEILSPLRDNDTAVPRSAVDAVFGRLDAIAGEVRQLNAPAAAGVAADASVAAASAPAAEEPVRTVRAELAQMDALLEGVAASHVLLNTLRGTLQSIMEMRGLVDLVAEQVAPGGMAEALPPRVAPARQSHALAEELRSTIGSVMRRIVSTADQLERELDGLRDNAEQLRLTPAASLITVLERTARDTANAQSKQIVFEAHGGDIRLEADMLVTAQGALIQLVRNAVAHGIEPADARQVLGKTAAGRITIEVARRGNRIVFICRDDGRGLDLDAVRKAVVQRGMAGTAVNQLSGDALIEVLLRGGISTSETVTEIAGRGVGLDVVRDASVQLRGSVSVTTEAGTGTVFELSVPLSLASMESLVVEAGGRTAVVPLDAVRATMVLGAAAVSRNTAGTTVLYNGQAIPFLWLPSALGDRRMPTDRGWPTFIAAAAGRVAAVGVDRLRGTRRTVVRSLPDLAPAAAIVAGAFLDPEGNPQLVLSPEGLIDLACRPGAAETEAARPRHPVLVVDDSLTTRMLEQTILEAAGYQVDLAVSAEEALEITRRKRYALILVDVDMPGIDGFTFVERIRADPQLRDIPAILVTSRAAPEDRQRGVDVGANGYIVKGEFNQNELLGSIRSLIG